MRKRDIICFLVGSLTAVLIAAPIGGYQLREERRRTEAAREEAELLRGQVVDALRAATDDFRATEDSLEAIRQRQVKECERLADDPDLPPEIRRQYADLVRQWRAEAAGGKK